MKHLLSILLCITFLASGVWIARSTGDWSYVARSGALIVVAAVLLEALPVLLAPRADDVPMWESPESHSAIRISILLICLGTLLQGFGDIAAEWVFSDLPPMIFLRAF